MFRHCLLASTLHSSMACGNSEAPMLRRSRSSQMRECRDCGRRMATWEKGAGQMRPRRANALPSLGRASYNPHREP